MPEPVLEWHGIGLVGRRLSAVGEVLNRAVLQAVSLEAEAIMADSKKNYVPVKTGALRSSGRVIHARRRGNQHLRQVVAKMLYGGSGGVTYAMIVHERHATKSDYLGRPLRAHLVDMDDRIGAHIRRSVGM